MVSLRGALPSDAIPSYTCSLSFFGALSESELNVARGVSYVHNSNNRTSTHGKTRSDVRRTLFYDSCHAAIPPAQFNFRSPLFSLLSCSSLLHL